jgi:hypothetical protein
MMYYFSNNRSFWRNRLVLIEGNGQGDLRSSAPSCRYCFVYIPAEFKFISCVIYLKLHLNNTVSIYLFRRDLLRTEMFPGNPIVQFFVNLLPILSFHTSENHANFVHWQAISNRQSVGWTAFAICQRKAKRKCMPASNRQSSDCIEECNSALRRSFPR